MKSPLPVTVTGDSGPPLLLVHGFLGSRATWDLVVPKLAQRYLCLAVDLPGHGGSRAPEDREAYAMELLGESLLATLNAFDVAETHVLGYSLGGRIALHFALRYPERVTKLVCESANPGIDDLEQREERCRSDESVAEMVRSSGIAGLVDYWESLPLFASQLTLAADVLRKQHRERMSVAETAAGFFLTELTPGKLSSLWPEIESFAMPLLTIAGSRDGKYKAIAQRMGTLSPRIKVQIIAGAGHNTHLERPDDFAATVLDFLA